MVAKDKKVRLAEALRANLSRRKAQARAAAAGEGGRQAARVNGAESGAEPGPDARPADGEDKSVRGGA